MKRAGAGVPSANRITLLRDADGDGVAGDAHASSSRASTRPSAWRWSATTLYVANTDAVVRFPYTDGRDADRRRRREGGRPARRARSTTTGPRTSSPAATARKLYATVGSNSNVAENGMDKEEGRAAIWRSTRAAGAHARCSPPACAIPNGMGWEPQTGALWTVVNERDEIGSDLVPDYLTSVRDGGFYGWPYSYFGQHVDERVKPPRPDLVAKAIVPDYALGSHAAPLGLAFYDGEPLPAALPRAARSSASTARGTAGRPAATR